MGKKLYVGNFSHDVVNAELEQMFAAHGAVISAQIINDRDTGRSKGFGFVEMSSEEQAEAAVAALNGHHHNGPRSYCERSAAKGRAARSRKSALDSVVVETASVIEFRSTQKGHIC